MKRISILVIITLTLSNLVGCRKLVEVEPPPTKFDATKAYATDGNAAAVLTNMYQEMSNDGFAQGASGISVYGGLLADELTDYQFEVQRTAVYQNSLSAFNVPFWSRFYYFVYTTNAAILGISTSETLTPSVKTRLLGEAKFMRAFIYFYLVNFWGDVPLMTTNDYRINNTVSRSPKDVVYQQIINDLKEANELLGEEYLLSDIKTSTEERIRPNKWTAAALLARTYLYYQKYDLAAKVSSEIIEQKTVYDLTDLDHVFLMNSKEAIWQIQPTSMIWNTFEARAYILTQAPNNFQPISLNTKLVAEFEEGDARRTEWIGTFKEGNETFYYPLKYKVIGENEPLSEYLSVFRLAEQYLIRAESKAHLGDLDGAIEDLNFLRRRSRIEPTDQIPLPLPDLNKTLNKEKVLDAVIHERRVELFTEWGHRWFDLKRTEKVDDVMKIETPLKGGTWESYKALLPIPIGDITVNKNISQNPGY